jgi:hypothetical protein
VPLLWCARISCYLSDDGAAMLTFEALTETAAFARVWVPFCKTFAIEPRAPEMYFVQKVDYLRDQVHPEFVKARRKIKVSAAPHPPTHLIISQHLQSEVFQQRLGTT